MAAAWRPTSRTKRFVCDAERSTGAITSGSHSPSSPLHPSTTRSNAQPRLQALAGGAALRAAALASRRRPYRQALARRPLGPSTVSQTSAESDSPLALVVALLAPAADWASSSKLASMLPRRRSCTSARSAAPRSVANARNASATARRTRASSPRAARTPRPRRRDEGVGRRPLGEEPPRRGSHPAGSPTPPPARREDARLDCGESGEVRGLRSVGSARRPPTELRQQLARGGARLCARDARSCRRLGRPPFLREKQSTVGAAKDRGQSRCRQRHAHRETARAACS